MCSLSDFSGFVGTDNLTEYRANVKDSPHITDAPTPTAVPIPLFIS